MKRPSALRSLLGLALVVATGCYQEPKPPALPVPAPSTSTEAAEAPALPVSQTALWGGEKLIAEVSTSGVTVGRYELWVERPCVEAGRPMLRVGSRAERTGVYAAFDDSGAVASSLIDAQEGVPVSSRAQVESERDIKLFDVRYTPGSFQYRFDRRPKIPGRLPYYSEKDRRTPEHVPLHDIHSALGRVRAHADEIGWRGVLLVVFGRTLYQIDVEVAAREEVEAAGTSYKAIRIDGVARRLNYRNTPLKRQQGFSLWVSDEPIHLPVRAQLDTNKRVLVAELLDYVEPARTPQPQLAPCQAPDEVARSE
ncbi:MAG: DUF3108 domain-containing protein [Myxococcales bacterium]|nr:DUF3108 domain-containing protein [Myxococcales bacterium]